MTRRRELGTIDAPTEKRPAAELERGDHLRRAGRPHALDSTQLVRRQPGQILHPPGARDEPIGQRQGVRLAAAAAKHHGEELVVSERTGALARELFSRSVVWCHLFHRRYTRSLMHPRRAIGYGCLLTTLLAAACAEPPSKEMDQAQGAINAARAAGADVYAVSEYTAATEALTQANEAVAARDFRLALNHALESGELAQNAARVAADTHAKVRADVERSTADARALLATARARLMAAGAARVPSRLLAQPNAEIAVAQDALQESGKAMAAGEYLAASATLTGVTDRLRAAVAAIDAATRAQPVRRRPAPRR